MAKLERVREVLSKPLEPEYVKLRAEAGWKLVAVEWEREVEEAEKPPRPAIEEIPYGLRVGDDCMHLVENPAETEVLIRMLDGIVQDLPFSKIADELNRSGLRTRSGTKWEPVLVYNMLPRLIQVGPRIFSSEEWQAQKKHVVNYGG
ncbi:MAG TPA: recombinase family protein [Terriglobia bacterium]|nr:recombinase family protein [Terriglobia bacterium]